MTQTLNERVAAEVRAELGRQQISVNAFAQRLGWTQPYLQRRVVGLTPALDLNDVEAIARELGVSVSDLIAPPSIRAAS